MSRALRTLFVLSLTALLPACKDPKADMADQQKSDPHETTEFFADGNSSRPLVAGVVPREGIVPSTPVVAGTPIPFEVTRETLNRGQLQFNIYCSPCHGTLGNGDGMIVQRGFTRPPSFHIQRLKDVPDSHFYNVITSGYGAMYSYDDRIAPEDRWRIAAYVRALQAAGDSRNLTDADRAKLMAEGDRKTPPPQRAGGQTP